MEEPVNTVTVAIGGIGELTNELRQWTAISGPIAVCNADRLAISGAERQTEIPHEQWKREHGA
jgi:hypothetical protein